MTTSWTLEDFETAVTEDDTLKGITNINMKVLLFCHPENLIMFDEDDNICVLLVLFLR